jgi:hypothetical protein
MARAMQRRRASGAATLKRWCPEPRAVPPNEKEIEMRAWILTASLLAGLVLVPGALVADEQKSLEQLVVEMADTPADHAAVAAHFRAKAADARAAAQRHKSMARAYGGGKLNTRLQMRGHCDRLSEENEAIAVEYEALAKLHDELAKPAP